MFDRDLAEKVECNSLLLDISRRDGLAARVGGIAAIAAILFVWWALSGRGIPAAIVFTSLFVCACVCFVGVHDGAEIFIVGPLNRRDASRLHELIARSEGVFGLVIESTRMDPYVANVIKGAGPCGDDPATDTG